VFKPIFSMAFALITAAVFALTIGLVWWGTGHYPGNTWRAVIGVLAALAGSFLEAELARRHARRKRPAATSHRKTSA
jgi:hypothetical protein